MTTADTIHPEMTNNNTEPSFEALATQLLANSAEALSYTYPEILILNMARHNGMV